MRAAPIAARVHLAHAVVQKLADDAGIDLLHLKGPAVLPGPARRGAPLQRRRRPGASRATSPGWSPAVESVGFEQRTDFATGSVFAHAANWWHDDWGWVDVHVSWPGRHRRRRAGLRRPRPRPRRYAAIAHRDCPVPDRTAQRLILVLHSARSGGTADVDHAWSGAEPHEQDAVRAPRRASCAPRSRSPPGSASSSCTATTRRTCCGATSRRAGAGSTSGAPGWPPRPPCGPRPSC